MPTSKETAAEIRRLYALPLEEFIGARDELAKRRRQEKRPDDAEAAKALRKPTPSAWAVNVLFEREPAKMEELIAAGKRAREAQGDAVSGRGVEKLKDSLGAARRLSDELRWEAGRLLAERGKAPDRAMVERIAANLQALAFSPSTAEVAERRWLDRDLDPPGFEVLAGLSAGAPVVDLAQRREARRQEKDREREEERDEAGEAPRSRAARGEDEAGEKEEKDGEGRARERAAKEREEREGRRRDEAERARREREDEARRKQLAAAEEKAERAREEAESLAAAATRAERDAADARRTAETAERAAVRARDKAEVAAERLARAEEALAAAAGEAGRPLGR